MEPAPTPPREPVLALDTLIVRPTILIDGQRYEILSPDELSIVDSHRLGAWGRELDALANAEGADAEARCAELVDRMARQICVGVPDAVFARLPGAHKWAIVDVFTGLLLGKRLGVAGAIAKATGIEMPAGTPWTGAMPSPGSSGSTAASPDGGFTRRLARWFGLS